ncbi:MULTISPECIES: hypothetical protein [unclassified Maribacter]|uniref:hypothetical protein n=1 Tax=unclassified Maribacter TaxID=2615042 RepID=UPI00047BAADA|nr:MULTISPECIES: hypothetical protein [unclassified Maribacter]|tara:strand:- start:181 stop:789 length:609 start_codon:yes stop_codon:yes gene_type:complete
MKKIFIIFITVSFCSCAGGKYNYLFDTGKELDFSQGKWILNRTESNSKVFDQELNTTAYNEFKEIIGDSLFELNTLRANKLISPKIGFELNEKELQQIGKESECDYLINIRGSIVSNGAGTLSYNSGDGFYSASNQSSVFILIYDLKSGIIISSSQAFGKATEENSHFDNENRVPSFHSSAETLMVKAAKNLIKKYGRNRLD